MHPIRSFVVRIYRQDRRSIAGLVEDVNLRQMMLGLRSETARLKQLDEYLPSYVARLREAGRVRELARRNGHGRRTVS